MKYKLIPLVGLIFTLAVKQTDAWMHHVYPFSDAANALVNDGSLSAPLYLTPHIESGKLAEGRKLSAVHNLPNAPNVTSYSGFLTVNKQHNSNLFFWFFPPLSGKVDHNTPLLLWLSGGPGSSSLFSLFTENGPFVVAADRSVHLRNYTWNREFAVIYIDQPAGTGFSFTDSERGYARNQTDVARDLYEALRQWFTLFADYRGNPFYITGESYAGKYVPAIAYKIHQMGNDAKKAGINLHGLAISAGWCDPPNMYNYGDFLYQVGLLDNRQLDHFHVEQAKVAAAVGEGNFTKAFLIMDQLMDGDDLVPGGLSYFKIATGLPTFSTINFLYDNEPDELSHYEQFIALPTTREALHVGNLTFHGDPKVVKNHLVGDIMDSVKPWLEKLLDARYSVLLYSGQLDVIVATPLIENYLAKLTWSSSSAFNNSTRKIYKVEAADTAVAGYIRQADNLVYAVVRKAGHMVQYDQPRVAYDLIRRFVKRQLF